MSKRTYRLCLIIVMLAVIATACIWYKNYGVSEDMENGILVKNWKDSGEEWLG